MSSNTSTSASYHGLVETTMHALQLCYAAQQGVIPRCTRRLSEDERATNIRSGAVFIFSVNESNMQRWTDHRPWGPSRIVGNFLVYRELSQRGAGRRRTSKASSSQEPKSPSPGLAPRSIGAAEDFVKPDGLIKKTITIGTNGCDLHLVSYYTQKDIREGNLGTAFDDHTVAYLRLPVEIFSLNNLRHPPTVVRGPTGRNQFSFNSEHLDDLEFRPDSRQFAVSVTPSPRRSPTTTRRDSSPAPAREREASRTDRHWSHSLGSSASGSSASSSPPCSGQMSDRSRHSTSSDYSSNLANLASSTLYRSHDQRSHRTVEQSLSWRGQIDASHHTRGYRPIEEGQYHKEPRLTGGASLGGYDSQQSYDYSPSGHVKAESQWATQDLYSTTFDATASHWSAHESSRVEYAHHQPTQSLQSNYHNEYSSPAHDNASVSTGWR